MTLKNAAPTTALVLSLCGLLLSVAIAVDNAPWRSDGANLSPTVTSIARAVDARTAPEPTPPSEPYGRWLLDGVKSRDNQSQANLFPQNLPENFRFEMEITPEKLIFSFSVGPSQEQTPSQETLIRLSPLGEGRWALASDDQRIASEGLTMRLDGDTLYLESGDTMVLTFHRL